MIWSDFRLIAGTGACAHRVRSCVLTGQVDFDGDQMYKVWPMDNESKAKAYGGWGHHQTLDRHVPYRISGYAGLPSTVLMNLNVFMNQQEFAD